MFTLLTFAIGIAGGSIAFYFSIPLPWLLGSLLTITLLKKCSFIKAPPKPFARWMRILLGVALGGAVADRVSAFDITILISLISAIAFVSAVTIFGLYYFRRLPNFSRLDSFMSALPGGLTFLVSMSGDLGERFPKIALIHTVRMVALILVFSTLAYFLDGSETIEQETFYSAFAFPIDFDLWEVLLLVIVCWLFTERFKIAGGDIMFPMIVSALFYGVGWVSTPMPEIMTTLAMITFGIVLGCKIAKAEFSESLPQVKASLIFTAIAISLALVISIGLGETFNQSYLLFFLALAPGSIPEMCLIAMALGFDVGFVALVHTCRYLFIMLIGAFGFHILNAKENAEVILNKKAG
ncbi:MAG: AbrB family transcriptional regulator [Cellvibrionaceae bacterium]